MFAVMTLAATMAFSAPESDSEVNAHKAALDLAGAFSNEGFKIRDGHWSGTIKPHDHALIAVNLYAGNQYWFSVGATDTAKKLVGEFFQFLTNISGPLTARRIQRRAQFRRWVWEWILFWIFVIAHSFLLKVKQR